MRDTDGAEALSKDADADELAVIVAHNGEKFERVSAADLPSMVDSCAVVGVVQPSVRPLLGAALARHREARDNTNRLTLIVPSRAPPLNDRRRDDEVFSFLASADLLRRAHLETRPLRNWCFELTHSLLSGVRLDVDVQIVHKLDTSIPTLGIAHNIDVIIPHRGPERYLRLSVDSMTRQGVPARIAVALDQQARCAKFLHDVRDNPSVQVFQLFPHPVGPYVTRHHLGRAGTADYIAWQDSDDVSLSLRLRTLVEAANAHGAGLAGSHELRMDEVTRQILAVRYPLDASGALERFGAGHQVLFPMTIVRRDVFAAVGGFSTNRTFGLDVNFWLSASLHTRIINVDEFLYIRRRWPGSLTMRPDIGSNSNIRTNLRKVREADYTAVRAGRMRIEDSSLGLTHRDGPVEMRPLTPKVPLLGTPGCPPHSVTSVRFRANRT